MDVLEAVEVGLQFELLTGRGEDFGERGGGCDVEFVLYCWTPVCDEHKGRHYSGE